ncbi:MAG: DUF1488 family protein [Pseudomonadota bacterium]
MPKLQFPDPSGRFDGRCVRFEARDGSTPVSCGVTIYALKHQCSDLPLEGLLPAESFLAAYNNSLSIIHMVAAQKYSRSQFEPQGDVDIMVHDHDFG